MNFNVPSLLSTLLLVTAISYAADLPGAGFSRRNTSRAKAR